MPRFITRLGFTSRLLAALSVSLVSLGALAWPVVSGELRDAATVEGLRIASADAASIESAAREADEGEDVIGEAEEVLASIARRPGTRAVALVDDRSRIVASGAEGAEGGVEASPRVRAALRTGRSQLGEGRDRVARIATFEYAVPVALPDGNHVLALDHELSAVNDQLAGVRSALLTVGLISLPGALLLFWLLGGRVMGRRHRDAVERSLRDGLTGLGNHRAFVEEIDPAVSLARRRGQPLSLVALDVDGFKATNDRYGHRHGDAVLERVAAALADGRDGDRAFRTGGDEFLLLLPATSAAGALARLERMLSELERAHHVRLSAGVAELGHDAPEAEALREAADAALYVAKRSGATRVVAFAEIADEQTTVTPAKVRSLRRVLDDGAVSVAWQPIMRLSDAPAPLAYEALARFDARTGFSGPLEAFAAAERSGLVRSLDAMCRSAALREASGLPGDALIFLNVAGESMVRGDELLAELQELCARDGIAPGRIVLEVSEQSASRPRTLALTAVMLREAGFGVALDDVGSGNAGLAMLRGLPVDYVKIDRSVVVGAADDPAARGALRAAVAFAEEIGAQVIAEGVEDERTLETLREFERAPAPVVYAVQGYLFGRPEPLPVAPAAPRL